MPPVPVFDFLADLVVRSIKTGTSVLEKLACRVHSGLAEHISFASLVSYGSVLLTVLLELTSSNDASTFHIVNPAHIRAPAQAQDSTLSQFRNVQRLEH